MAQIEAKLRYVPVVEYFCDNCGRYLGSDEFREGMDISKEKLHLYRWYYKCCPKCKATFTKPKADDWVVVDTADDMLYGTLGGRDAGSC